MKTLSTFFLCAAMLLGQDGKKQFETRCGGCHGLDGAGGEHGPNIVETRRRATREHLVQVITEGTDGGMPAFKLQPKDLEAVVGYVSVLRAPALEHPAPGDAAAGERFFNGAGKCGQCHMVQGRGGLLGPELSNIGRERRLPEIAEGLRHSGERETAGYRAISVRLHDGRTLRGLVKNESTFDLQLQTPDCKLHLLSKDQIADQKREAKLLAPEVAPSAADTQNLLAYLSRLNSPEGAPHILAGTVANAAVDTPKPGDWPTYNGNVSGNRHSPLRQINTANVAQLGAKWIFPIHSSKRLQVTPLVLDGVMYVTAANEAFALDARSGRQIWHYARPLTKGVIGDAGGAINRGVAVRGDKVFLATDHAHLIALSRTNGQLLWESEMADFHEHYGTTSAPLVVDDLVLMGSSGGDEGSRGFLDAFHADTGERAWRFWSMPAKGDPEAATWVGRAIEHGCAAAWLTGTYDPETKLVYWPTGNPCPDYNGDERKGDNLYSSSVLALEPKTGKLRWYFQFTPHDTHDWDATETPMLIDAVFQGRPRKLLAQANRNGFFYVLDRVTGEFLLGEPFVHKLTWASGIGKDGRPKVLPGSEPTVEGVRVCPSVVGAANWMSTAYNPATGLYYVMADESCNIYTKSDAWWEPGKSFYGGGARHVPGETDEKFVRALDLQTGKLVWEVPQIGPGSGWGGLMSTAGGLVFYCDESGAFAALDAKTGKRLWHFHTNESWHASPMTYMVDGKQYLAVAAGSNILAFALP